MKVLQFPSFHPLVGFFGLKKPCNFPYLLKGFICFHFFLINISCCIFPDFFKCTAKKSTSWLFFFFSQNPIWLKLFAKKPAISRTSLNKLKDAFFRINFECCISPDFFLKSLKNSYNIYFISQKPNWLFSWWITPKRWRVADSYCVKAYAQALEVIPYTLAENAGLDPIKTVTELRQRHKEGDKMAGINVRKGTISSMKDEKVLQPFLVSSSEVTLASETVRSILKIDDVINTITDTYLG